LGSLKTPLPEQVWNDAYGARCSDCAAIACPASRGERLGMRNHIETIGIVPHLLRQRSFQGSQVGIIGLVPERTSAGASRRVVRVIKVRATNGNVPGRRSDTADGGRRVAKKTKRSGIARSHQHGLPLCRGLLPQRRPKLVPGVSKKSFAIAKADA